MEPRVFGFTGQMGAGKSTAASLLNYHLSGKRRVLKFADPLYRIQTAVYTIAELDQPKTKDRELLQWLGSWAKTKCPTIWTDIWVREVIKLISEGYTIICDDCRFNPEAQAIHSLGGKVVQVVASKELRANRIDLVNEGHESERGLGDEHVDFKLTNNGSLFDLEQQVIEVLRYV